VRAGATPAPSDATGGEAFQNELVRRRRQEAPDKPEQAAPARKAEPKRTGKPRAAGRPARGTQTEKAQESDNERDRAQQPEARAPTTPAGGDADAPEAEDAHAADKSAGAETHDHDTPNDAAALVAGGLGTTPTAGSADADEAPDPDATAEADQAAPVAAGAEALLRARSVAHAADQAAEQTSPEVQPAHPAPSHAGQGPALFAGDGEDAPRGVPTSPGKRPAGPASPSPDSDPAAQVASVAQTPQVLTASDRPARADNGNTTDVTTDVASGLLNARAEPAHAGATAAPAAPPLPPEVRFATANHENIVTSMRAEVLPNGGTRRLRLDPPQLGALQVTVQVRDGLITAAFETSNDEATRLLGHSLNQLKSVLESHGVAVDKLQVQQAPRDTNPSSTNDDTRRDQGGHSHEQEQHARQEQQRREMLQRMWRRLAGGQDPLDLTA
jgi:flagellar hook-length control protein FliK